MVDFEMFTEEGNEACTQPSKTSMMLFLEINLFLKMN
jgi:hypothetical protein